MFNQEQYGLAVDYWSFGALLFELLTGNPPWYEKNQSWNTTRTEEKITCAPIDFPGYISPEAEALISGLMIRDPVKRYCFQQAQEHCFFDICKDKWDAIEQKQPGMPGLTVPLKYSRSSDGEQERQQKRAEFFRQSNKDREIEESDR
jgi:serine/threonine protein kinase